MQPDLKKSYLYGEGTEMTPRKETPVDDREIIELYFERNESAISETDKKYGKLCRKIANKIIGDEHDSDECVNDTYLGVWNAIPPEKPNSLCAFVARIARNLAINRLKYRAAAKRNSGITVSLSELEEIISDTSTLDNIEDMELGGWISDFLYMQDEETRNIFVRKYWFFDSVEELSLQYGYTESKIKSILFRTRNKLRMHLEMRGVAI